MTLFVLCQNHDPDFINVSDIVSLSLDKSQTHQTALLRDGRKVELARGAMEETALTAFPAQPGQCLLLAYRQSNETIFFERIPLVAWRVTLLGSELRPMTANGEVERVSNELTRAILNTDGSVTTRHAQYSTEDNWHTTVQKDYPHKRVVVR